MPTGISALKVWKGVRRFTLQPQIVHEPAEDDSPLLSAMQCKKQLKKAKGWFLVNVMHVMEDEQPPEKPVESVLKPSVQSLHVEQHRKHLIAEARLKHLLGNINSSLKTFLMAYPQTGVYCNTQFN